jgi:hypothetical protein
MVVLAFHGPDILAISAVVLLWVLLQRLHRRR